MRLWGIQGGWTDVAHCQHGAVEEEEDAADEEEAAWGEMLDWKRYGGVETDRRSRKLLRFL